MTAFLYMLIYLCCICHCRFPRELDKIVWDKSLIYLDRARPQSQQDVEVISNNTLICLSPFSSWLWLTGPGVFRFENCKNILINLMWFQYPHGLRGIFIIEALAPHNYRSFEFSWKIEQEMMLRETFDKPLDLSYWKIGPIICQSLSRLSHFQRSTNVLALRTASTASVVSLFLSINSKEIHIFCLFGTPVTDS